MSEAKWCQRQDSCPLLLGAIEAKVEAEHRARVAKHNQDEAAQAFDAKRTLFNEFYKLVDRCRKSLEGGRAGIGRAHGDAAERIQPQATAPSRNRGAECLDPITTSRSMLMLGRQSRRYGVLRITMSCVGEIMRGEAPVRFNTSKSFATGSTKRPNCFIRHAPRKGTWRRNVNTPFNAMQCVATGTFTGSQSANGERTKTTPSMTGLVLWRVIPTSLMKQDAFGVKWVTLKFWAVLKKARPPNDRP